jgi:hypothetical protein
MFAINNLKQEDNEKETIFTSDSIHSVIRVVHSKGGERYLSQYSKPAGINDTAIYGSHGHCYYYRRNRYFHIR